jgi:hypothetical protein
VNESLRNEILKNVKSGVVRKPEVRPSLRSPSDISIPARDVLHQFEANLAHLEDLHGRLSFVMNEVRLVVRR